MIHWRHEMEPAAYLLDEEPEGAVSGQSRAIVISPELFDRIADYSRSQPTSPSAGRVYRKNLGWPDGMPDNWFVYLVIDADEDGRYQDHVPYQAELS